MKVTFLFFPPSPPQCGISLMTYLPQFSSSFPVDNYQYCSSSWIYGVKSLNPSVSYLPRYFRQVAKAYNFSSIRFAHYYSCHNIFSGYRSQTQRNLRVYMCPMVIAVLRYMLSGKLPVARKFDSWCLHFTRLPMAAACFSYFHEAVRAGSFSSTSSPVLPFVERLGNVVFFVCAYLQLTDTYPPAGVSLCFPSLPTSVFVVTER